MITWRVTLMKKGTFNGKEVAVQAKTKEEASNKAVLMQGPMAGTYTVMTVIPDADRMETKFKHKGLRYTR